MNPPMERFFEGMIVDITERLARLIAVLFVVLPIVAVGQTCNSHVTATAPASQFTDNGNGTVTDKSTGLTWMRCAMGQSWSSGTSACSGTATAYIWQNALNAANGFSYGGYSDWRLPNDKELSSITERSCAAPAINLTVFPGTPAGAFWTSTPNINTAGDAWVVSFVGGNSRDDQLMTTPYYVRLVRGGP